MAPRVWLITGCSSGFGKEIAIQVLERGDKVIATARNVSRIAALRDAGAEVLDLDVSAGFKTIEETVKAAHDIYGRLDILVNNAAFVQEGAVEELSPEEVLSCFNTNVFGALNVVRAVGPYMRQQRSGIIANVSSMAGWIGIPGCGVYAATKAALSCISEALTHELAPFGITVTAIEPGYFRSNLLQLGNRNRPMNRLAHYDGTAAHETADHLDKVNNKQLGNVAKGCSVIIDVLTQSGTASGRDIPIRLPLGSDMIQCVGMKCRETLALLDEWKDIASSTAHDDVQ
ncbi:putative secondary metabolism biosynthetic enzyme [Coccidioides posadasii str. Silveira]|uniref:Ketoreductase domain-containing protein n=2 Tax=Coccidioides posadasii TaxID=199306 RepID=E9DBK8_COCPS|nr:oxidoreductase,short chain dehydrogenase, putative [Coccidioides posadasii C735 delta SOWgp]EER27770.1 oxidoreductase,short chain dehydrogenase, putative [Coccidioides posadasii C735 delta SOWgp]EFW16160.1 conserved hypothetical protein [Coccidioides posadasii str. Silveira]QVM11478.1 putative secondary metabolism biosynthetic enzyme [Coccidioides posadasii str. Silveira]|eukprot:XP_003069915.1 oxidoreductase,short chain dehydrogenase, putative [Coccidioides posadasii C735 delta SOWgp]